MVKTQLPFRRSVVLVSHPLSTLLVFSTSQNPAGGDTLTVVFPTFASRECAAEEIKQAIKKTNRRIKILPKACQNNPSDWGPTNQGMAHPG
jgi:hypothetical protein